MRAFRRRRGYYVAELEGDEATILSRVVADTAMLLGGRLDHGPDAAAPPGATSPASATGPDTDPGPASGSATEAETGPDTPQDPLQAMSWPTEGVSAPTDPALARLLPDA